MELLRVNSKHVAVCNNSININDYLNMVFEEAKQVALKHPVVDYRELVTPGYLALGDAKKEYNPGMGAQFSTFASKTMRGSMLDECRCLEHIVSTPRRNVKVVSLSDYENSEYEPYSMEAYYEAEESGWRDVVLAQVREVMNQLTPIQRFVVDCRIGRFGETMTFAQIGKILNCSPQNAQKVFNCAIKKIRDSVRFVAFAA